MMSGVDKACWNSYLDKMHPYGLSNYPYIEKSDLNKMFHCPHVPADNTCIPPAKVAPVTDVFDAKKARKVSDEYFGKQHAKDVINFRIKEAASKGMLSVDVPAYALPETAIAFLREYGYKVDVKFAYDPGAATPQSSKQYDGCVVSW